MRRPKKQSPKVIIRRTDSLGTGDAETDARFQETAFVDTGALAILRDTENPKRIVLGRTGAGKTLLAIKLKEYEENVIDIDPSSLAMQYVSNSTMIRFAEEIGAHLGAFFFFLWLHVITVELLKKRYGITSPAAKRDLMTRLLDQVSDSKKRAMEYVAQYGDKFWQETEHRVKEFTDKIESELSAAIRAGTTKGSHLKVGVNSNIPSEQRTELVHRAKDVINKVQLRELGEIINLLSEDVFTDRLQKFYVIIDGLDEEWAEDIIRYRLIKTLIDAIRKMISVRNVKVIICLRTDILYKVLEETKTTGSQEEKYESLFFDLKWTDSQLKEIVDQRAAELFKSKYTGALITVTHLLPPNQMEQKSALDYIISRTLKRPRDIIHFFNECIQFADGKSRFTAVNIRQAERVYSNKRLRSIQDEWRSVYPNLGDYLTVLEGGERAFSTSDIDEDKLERFILKSSEEKARVHGPMYAKAKEYMHAGTCSAEDVALNLLYHLYLVGVIGIKPSPRSATEWSFETAVPLRAGALNSDMSFRVHPTFWFALGMG